MESPLIRIHKRVLEVIQQEIQHLMDNLLKDAFDPAKLMRLIKSIGIDMSQLPGLVGQQPGFDPYQILGLDKSASDEEVKKRYGEMMMKIHPDRAGKEMTFLAAMVNVAYELIEKERKWK